MGHCHYCGSKHELTETTVANGYDKEGRFGGSPAAECVDTEACQERASSDGGHPQFEQVSL